MSFLIGLLFFIIAIALFVLVFFFSILRNTFRIFMGKQKPADEPQNRMARKYVNKKFTKQEGEYVDFEEIKE
jgi:hypothetical protein